VSIVISAGIHGLLLVWLNLNTGNKIPSANNGQRSIDIIMVVDPSPAMFSKAAAGQLLVDELFAEGDTVHSRPQQVTVTSEKPIEYNIKKTLARKKVKNTAQVNMHKGDTRLVRSANTHRAVVTGTSRVKSTLIEDTAFSEEAPGGNTELKLSPVTVPVSIRKTYTSAADQKLRKRIKKNYLAGLRAAIIRYKSYPARAQRMRKQGNVWVEFLIHRDGRITQVAIRESSGEPVLDRAARKSVLRLGRYLPFPDLLDATFFSVAVPMNYTAD